MLSLRVVFFFNSSGPIYLSVYVALFYLSLPLFNSLSLSCSSLYLVPLISLFPSLFLLSPLAQFMSLVPLSF